jgi:cytochrome c-type biogenesis protein CcmH/NrfG
MFDPLGAEKDIEVGNFYFKKGNYDAAIERFQDAARKHAGYAKPYLLMAETYEKKDDAQNALEAYREFLKLYPQSPDRKRVEGRVADLQKKVRPEEKKKSHQ